MPCPAIAGRRLSRALATGMLVLVWWGLGCHLLAGRRAPRGVRNDQGFDLYDDQFRVPQKSRRTLYTERRAQEVSDPAIAWLEQHRAEPFFLFVHYFDPHQLYKPPEPFASRYASDPYADGIAYTDSHVGRVVGALERLGLYDSTLLVITADHGQALGAHGEETHGFFVYQGTIRVPLIVRAPDGARGITVDEPVSLVDIVPTVPGLKDTPAPAGLEGHDLSDLVLGRGARHEPTRRMSPSSRSRRRPSAAAPCTAC